MATMKRKKLGEILREHGKISIETLRNALDEQHHRVVRLGELLLERGLVRKADLIPALCEVVRVPHLDCSDAKPTRDALERVPRAVAERCCALPVEMKQKRLTVVMAEPQNLTLIDELRFASDTEIDPRFGFTQEIAEAIARCYKPSPALVAVGPRAQPSADLAAQAANVKADGIEFFSISTAQANREALRDSKPARRRPQSKK